MILLKEYLIWLILNIYNTGGGLSGAVVNALVTINEIALLYTYFRLVTVYTDK